MTAITLVIFRITMFTIPAPDKFPYNLTDRRHRYDIFFHSLHLLSS